MTRQLHLLGHFVTEEKGYLGSSVFRPGEFEGGINVGSGGTEITTISTGAELNGQGIIAMVLENRAT